MKTKTIDILSFLLSVICSCIVGAIEGVIIEGIDGLHIGTITALICIMIFTFIFQGIFNKIPAFIISGVLLFMFSIPFSLLIFQALSDNFNLSLGEKVICIILTMLAIFLYILCFKYAEKKNRNKIEQFFTENQPYSDSEIPQEVLEKLPDSYNDVSNQLKGDGFL